MKLKTLLTAGILSVFAAGSAFAEGELNLFNWGNYTSPELLEKFEAETGIKVTVDGYDSNDSMFAKVKAGGHGYDLAVPSDFMVKVMIDEGLIQPVNAGDMENFSNLKSDHVDVYYDPGRKYSVPWQHGSTGISLNTAHYNGPKSDSWAMVFDAPEELKGRINMVSEMADVIAAGLFYLGFDQCNSNTDELKILNETLTTAKQDWRTIDYGVIEKLTSGDVYASHNWNGASMRARLDTPSIKYVFPKEGLAAWADNVVLLSDAQNVDEAKAFMNFIMAPENAALISNFARYGNAVKGSEEYMDEVMATAPEIVGYDGMGQPQFIPTCPQEVTELYTKIWNNLLK